MELEIWAYRGVTIHDYGVSKLGQRYWIFRGEKLVATSTLRDLAVAKFIRAVRGVKSPRLAPKTPVTEGGAA